MHLRSLHLITVALIALSPPCRAQTGTVTFYSIQHGAGQQIADALIPFGHAPFAGLLYDGSQRMAHARGGRFMTFRLLAGEHRLSASYHSLEPGDPAVNLKVEDGGQYCVRLSSNYRNLVVIPLAVLHGVIEQVPCDQASKEAGMYKPLELKRIDATERTKLVSPQTFPRHD